MQSKPWREGGREPDAQSNWARGTRLVSTRASTTRSPAVFQLASKELDVRRSGDGRRPDDRPW